MDKSKSYYSLPWFYAIKSYLIQLINKKYNRSIIYFDDHISSRGRRGRKSLYREKYDDELNTCFRKNVAGFKPAHDVVWLKDKFPEVVVSTNSPSEKHIKNKYSALKR